MSWKASSEKKDVVFHSYSNKFDRGEMAVAVVVVVSVVVVVYI